MLRIDGTLDHLPVPRADVVTLLESVNAPVVHIPAHGVAATQAYVVGARVAPQRFRLYVYLRQPDNGASVTIYVSDPAELTAEQYQLEQAEAVRFLESMRFEMRDSGFSRLDPPSQHELMVTIGLFHGQRRSVVDLVEPVVSTAPDEIFGGLSTAERAAMREAGLPAPSSPAPAVPEPDPDPAAVPSPAPARRAVSSGAAAAGAARLGRLLSTFAVLAALGVGAEGCVASQGREPPTEAAVQTQVDIGNQQLGSGNFPAAIQTFEAILVDAPTNRDAHYGLGIAYLSLERPEEAERNLRRTIEVAPDWSVAKNTLATLLIQSNRCTEARELLQKVLNDIFYPTPEFAEHNLARAEACLGQVPEAVRRLDKLLTKRPQFCLGYLTLAELSAQAKQPETTISACDRFTRQCEENEHVRSMVDPEHSCLCYFRKGMAFAELGDVESARASFMSCRSTGTWGQECRRSLGMLPD
jgi:Tfp pilus assembly protein PilF